MKGLYPFTNKTLEIWQHHLNHLNEKCLVSEEVLTNIFEIKDLEPIFKRKLLGTEAINYLNPLAQFSTRYINEGWTWSKVLKLVSEFKSCVELCPGKSVVIDLALSYNNYSSVLTKIDYRNWDQFEPLKIKNKFSYELLNLNVITDTASIPTTDLILMNHIVDDLLMGLWGLRHEIDFFGLWNDSDKVDSCWEAVIEEGYEAYLPILKRFMCELIEKVNLGGHIILRDYPSAYETTRKQILRINFSRKLTLILIDELKENGMELLSYETDETFFILRKQKMSRFGR